MWHTITRTVGLVVVAALLALTAPVRSNAMVCIPAGSLGFTLLDHAPAVDSPVVIFFSPTTLGLLGSAGVDPGNFTGGASDALDSGVFVTDKLEIWSPCDVEKIADVTNPTFHGGTFFRGNYQDRFYRPYDPAGAPNTGVAASDTTGAVVLQWPLTLANQIQIVATNQDNTIAYYRFRDIGSVGAARRTVYRLDLTTGTDLGAWVTEPTREATASIASNILVLRNGQVLVGWSGAGATSSVVKRYATDGTELATYVLRAANSSEEINLVASLDDLTFWAAYTGTSDRGTLKQIRISDGAELNVHEVTHAEKFAVDAVFNNDISWQPDQGRFFVTREDCHCAMDHIIMEIRGAKKHGNPSDPRYTAFSLQTDGTDLFIKIPIALHGAPTKEVYRVKHGYSQRFTHTDSRTKIEMRGQVSSHVDPTVAVPVSKDDAWVELRINGRVYANGDDYDLIDPTSTVTGCRNGVTGLNTRNEYGWSIGMWQNEWLDCCYLDTVAGYCRHIEDDDDINDGTLGECPPPGPGGSSFDGAPDGDRYVAPGGCPAVYIPPTGEGAVASAPDPVDHQDLATLQTPLVSVDLTVCDGTVYRLAKSPLPRPGEAPCDARVMRFGAVPYPMSNRFGSMGPQTWMLEIADPDGTFRALLASGPNRFFKRWTADLFVEEDAARLRNQTRQRLARSRCVTVRTGDTDQRIVLIFTDEYSRHDSPYSLDRELSVALIGDIFAVSAQSPDLVSVPLASEEIGAKAATIILGEGSDEYRIDENPPVIPIGIIPLRLVGQVNLGGETWDAYFVNLYADYGIPALFGSNLDPDCPASVRLCPDAYDGTGITEFLVPGYTPWDGYFPNKYIEVTVNGVTYWVTMIFGRGPVSLQHVLQKVPLSANVNGVEETGDGTGALIDDAARQLQWLFDHPILRRTTSGLWGGVATYPDGLAKVNTASFEAAKAIHDARLSARYRGALIIDTMRAARDWLADALVSWHLHIWLNQHGQIVAHTINDRLASPALVGLPTFTDLRHIDADSFQITSELSAELENSLTFDAGPEPSSGRLTVPKATITAPDSIRDWGDTYTAQPLTFIGVHRPDIAHDVAARRLVWTQHGITKGEFRIDLAGGALSNGALIRLTHLAGIGQTGWTRRVLYVTDRELLIDDADWQTRVSWEDAEPALVQSGGGGNTPAVGFKPLGSTVAGTSWRLGSSVAGTAYRLG